MSYPVGLDEIETTTLRGELERRAKLRADGLCDYCARPPTTPACMYGARHVAARAKDGKRAPLESAEVRAREIARMLKEAMPAGWGFVVLLASFGDDGFSTYLSSMERATAIEFLREMATKIEKDAKQR